MLSQFLIHLGSLTFLKSTFFNFKFSPPDPLRMSDFETDSGI